MYSVLYTIVIPGLMLIIALLLIICAILVYYLPFFYNIVNNHVNRQQRGNDAKCECVKCGCKKKSNAERPH